MSLETFDPDQYTQSNRNTMTKKKDINLNAGSTKPAAAEQTENSLNIDSILKDPELMAKIYTEGFQLVQALQDIPAQLELLSRVTLATKFVTNNPDGTKDFKAEQFETLWQYLTTPQQEQEDE